MGQERRHFTDEFKRESVALLASSDRPLGQIAGELGISPSMLRNWRNRSGRRGAGTALHPSASASSPPSPDPTAEISRLRRENDRLRMERDILKRMARPVRKGLARGDLTGLRQRIRSRGWCPGQDGVPRALVLIKATALKRHF
jgi:transposase